MKHVELFDGTRHELRDLSVALAYDPVGTVALSDPARPFGAEMRVLLAGEHDIGYGEGLVFTPEDAALCVGNAKKRLAEGFIPLLYDHGWTARGTEGAGEVVDCFERNGDLWLSVDLADDDCYQACCKPGKKWKSRSLGFGAWIDSAGKLRPADPKECSFTNLPRLKGLGPIVSMSAYRREMSSLRPSTFFDMSQDAIVGARPSPEGRSDLRPSPDDGSLSSTPTTSPTVASARKEHEMKLSPEILARLGLPADASEEQINTALADQIPAKPQGATKEKSVADLMAEMDSRFDRRFQELSDRMAADRVAADAAASKAARVDRLLEKGIRLGKIHRGAAKLVRPGIAEDPDAFEAGLSAMPVIAPVADVFEAGDEPARIPTGSGNAATAERMERLSRVAKRAKTRFIPATLAAAELASEQRA